MLDAHPEVWQRCGDLAVLAQSKWLELICGKDLLLREALQRRLDQMKAELTGTDASLLERLLGERALATWLQVHYADALYAQVKVNSSGIHKSIVARQHAAHQLFLQSVKMLVTLRKPLATFPKTGEPQPRLFTPPAAAR
jgi:hypothetical protein